jgi:hypothetical protein
VFRAEPMFEKYGAPESLLEELREHLPARIREAGRRKASFRLVNWS